MGKLNDLFRNPPKGGNARGAETASSMAPVPKPLDQVVKGPWGGGVPHGGGVAIEDQRKQRELARMTDEQRMEYYRKQSEAWAMAPGSGPAAQPSLRKDFEDGERSSRVQAVQSGAVGRPEFRNFERGRTEAQEVDDPSGLSVYDREAASAGDPHGVVTATNANMAHGPLPKPVMNPDTKLGYRSDGKPNTPMGVNPSPTEADSGGDGQGNRNNTRRP